VVLRWGGGVFGIYLPGFPGGWGGGGGVGWGGGGVAWEA